MLPAVARVDQLGRSTSLAHGGHESFAKSAATTTSRCSGSEPRNDWACGPTKGKHFSKAGGVPVRALYSCRAALHAMVVKRGKGRNSSRSFLCSTFRWHSLRSTLTSCYYLTSFHSISRSMVLCVANRLRKPEMNGHLDKHGSDIMSKNNSLSLFLIQFSKSSAVYNIICPAMSGVHCAKQCAI